MQHITHLMKGLMPLGRLLRGRCEVEVIHRLRWSHITEALGGRGRGSWLLLLLLLLLLGGSRCPPQLLHLLTETLAGVDGRRTTVSTDRRLTFSRLLQMSRKNGGVKVLFPSSGVNERGKCLS